MRHLQTLPLSALAFAALGTLASAQGRAFQSPGMPSLSGGQMMGSGQVTRFSRDFNPAISMVVDGLYDYQNVSGSSEENGSRLELRTAEALVAAWIDPTAWVYATVASDGEELLLEEASIQYLGVGDPYVVRAGRFFIDFGKQMQGHVHDLRTIDRPLVLREYLGEEVSGDGVQWDHWLPVGEETILRYSLGAFQDLTAHEHGEEHGGGAEPEPVQGDRRKLGELNFTGRLTALSDAGENGQVQFGASARVLPSLAFENEDTGDISSASSNVVYGLDFTYGWQDETAIKNWTLGGEWLLADGALSAESTPGGVEVNNTTANGFYAFADHGWSQRSSAGLQFSSAELVEIDAGRTNEYDAYYTHHFSEFLRLRFGLGFADRETSPDSTRFSIQLTGFVGPHDHGVNW